MLGGRLWINEKRLRKLYLFQRPFRGGHPLNRNGALHQSIIMSLFIFLLFPFSCLISPLSSLFLNLFPLSFHKSKYCLMNSRCQAVQKSIYCTIMHRKEVQSTILAQEPSVLSYEPFSKVFIFFFLIQKILTTVFHY